jgi:hypothetical protein
MSRKQSEARNNSGDAAIAVALHDYLDNVSGAKRGSAQPYFIHSRYRDQSAVFIHVGLVIYI